MSGWMSVTMSPSSWRAAQAWARVDDGESVSDDVSATIECCRGDILQLVFTSDDIARITATIT